MKAIVIAFSLKHQSFDEIRYSVQAIREYHKEEVILIHGFMPKKEIKKRGFSDQVGILFRKHFPIQLNMYCDGVLRLEMAEVACMLDATIYVIGEIKGGVKEELDLYKMYELKIIEMPL
jgi:hypothetical protein